MITEKFNEYDSVSAREWYDILKKQLKETKSRLAKAEKLIKRWRSRKNIIQNFSRDGRANYGPDENTIKCANELEEAIRGEAEG